MTIEVIEKETNLKKLSKILYEMPDFPSLEKLTEWFMQNPNILEFSEEAYQEYAIERAKAVLNMAPCIKCRFLRWWKTGEFQDDIKIKRFNVNFLIERGLPAPYAFIAFNNLYENPDNYVILRMFYKYEGSIS